MINLARTILNIIILLLSPLTLGSAAEAQTPAAKKSETKSEARKDESKANLTEAALLEAQRRSFAISLVMSLADEARTYRDLALRPHVIARAADTLWDGDSETAPTQFRRASEAAEKADAAEITAQTKGNCLRKDGRSRHDLLHLRSQRNQSRRHPTRR